MIMTSQALVRWGGALLELAHFRQGEESMALIHEVSGTALPLWTTAEVVILLANNQPSGRDCMSMLQPDNSYCSTVLAHLPCIYSSSPLLTCITTLQAIGKLNDALAKDAGRADANWCLGNAYTSLVGPYSCAYICAVVASPCLRAAGEADKLCLAR